MKRKQKRVFLTKISAVTVLLSVVCSWQFFIFPTQSQAHPGHEPIDAVGGEEVTQLSQEINQQRQKIDQLQQQINNYKKQISAQQQESKSLGNQLAIIENDVARIELDIQATTAKIEQTNLEIQKINLEIKEQELQIEKQKQNIGEYLGIINRNDETSYLEVVIANNSFSEFFDYVKSVETIHSRLKKSLDQYKLAKQELEISRSNLEEKKLTEEKLKDQLLAQKAELEEKSFAQEVLLIQSRLTEREYRNAVYNLQLEQQRANADIASLEKKVRQQLEEREKAEQFEGFGSAVLSWPVNPAKGITAYFHDPTYPFRHLFEHPAIDIRASQGTAIKAPESGYVARVKFDGSNNYAYIMLIHNDNISTVFGHISGATVKEDEFVTKGQVIGYSGGAPNTPGAGNLSTGAHLHFEVRLDGIPVNPLEYLPAY